MCTARNMLFAGRPSATQRREYWPYAAVSVIGVRAYYTHRSIMRIGLGERLIIISSNNAENC